MSNTVKFKHYECALQLGRYENNALAIQLVSAVTDEKNEIYQGEPIGKATVFVEHIPLEKDQIIIKSYSENEGMLEAFEKAGLIGKSKAVNIEHVDVYVAEMTEKLKELAADVPLVSSRKKKM